jgi:transcriptional regulator with XRE-family HTH domain
MFNFTRKEPLMTIGERIRRVRMQRGLTQKELGIALGFPERSADVRIAQYESGTRKPKEDLIRQIAEVLHVNPHAISSVDYGTYIGLMYTLFDLEDTYGMHIDEIDGELCIRLDRHRKDYPELFDMMQHWYEAWKQDQKDSASPDDYINWKLNYPHYINRKKDK